MTLNRAVRLNKRRKIRIIISIAWKLFKKYIIIPIGVILIALFTFGNAIFIYLWLKERHKNKNIIPKTNKEIKP